MTARSGPWWRAPLLAATVLVLAPVAIGAVLLLGPGQVNNCLALYGCPLPQQPIIDASGLLMVVLLLSATWLVVAALTVRHLWSSDRARLIRAVGVAGVVSLATAVIVGGSRLADGQRLRVVAEDAGLYALGAVIAVVPLALAWAVLRGRAPRHGEG